MENNINAFKCTYQKLCDLLLSYFFSNVIIDEESASKNEFYR